jgi:hypothetical protein
MKTFMLETPNFDAVLRAAETGETIHLSGKSAEGEEVTVRATASKRSEEGGAEVAVAISPAKRETRFLGGYFPFSDRFCIE